MQRKWIDTTSRLQKIYSTAKVNVAGKLYIGESEINRFMMESRNFTDLLQAWTGWHNAIGPPSKDLFDIMIDLENKVAKAGGSLTIFILKSCSLVVISILTLRS